MKLTPEYALTMARYNAWQNRQLKAAFAQLDAVALTQDRGAFFGSILATASHILWGDRMWMSRLAGHAAPEGGFERHLELAPDRETWEIERFRTDSAIVLWAEGLRAVDLAGKLAFHSGVLGRDVEMPRALCVMQLFNHQTHHRGQIHAMLTAAGVQAPVSDVFLMPDAGPWL